MATVTNIAQKFVETAKAYGEKTAIIEAKSGKSITFGELDAKADSYAHFFNQDGVAEKEIVMLMVTPSIDFICLALAFFKLGTPIVLIDPGMGYRNLLRCIERVEPRYLIGIPKAVLFSILFRKQFKSLKERYCIGHSLGVLGINVQKKLDCNGPAYPVFAPEVEDLAAIIFTTGSTGPPKGVRYEHGIFSAQLELIQKYYKIGPEDTDQPAFPLFALFSAALGACSVIPDMNPTEPAKVDPGKFTDSIIAHKVTYSFGSPAIWNVVARFCNEKQVTLPSLKKVLMAGAPVPYELMDRTRKCISQEGMIFTPYGATESLPIVSIESREVLEETFEISRKGGGTCVGRALPGINIKIIQISDATIEKISETSMLAKNEIGEIIVRGDVVTRAYMNNEEETRLAKINDENTFWHRMGDVGYLDEKERLWFCGRRAHRVATAKKTLFPIPCEAIINEHQGVYRTALVGVKNNAGKTEPVIIVEPHKEYQKDRALLEEVKEIAQGNTLTCEIELFLVHEDFPVDIRHNAKIFREKLAKWAQKKIYP